MRKGNYTIICRNCKLKVARTPNKQCVNCSIPQWGYTSDEIVMIENPQKKIVQKFVCKNCNNTVVRTPLKKCHVCSMPFWGYNEFELDNGLVKLIEVPSSSGNHQLPSQHPKTQSHKIVIVTLLSLLLIGLGFLAVYFIVIDSPSKNRSNIDQGNYASSIDEIKKAVVFIKAGQGTGTGFLISDKYILTAGHVACDYNQFEIVFTKSQNETKRGKLVECALIPERTDFDYFERDFALIEIDPINTIKPLMLGNSQSMSELDDVYTAGHSLGDINLSLTEGGISRLKFGENSYDLFSHTIASNPGNSGGPIIDAETNQVIAILVGGRGPMLTQTDIIIPQGENIGVKINTVKYVLGDLLIN